MNDTKPATQSLTVWTCALMLGVVLLTAVLRRFGIELSEGERSTVDLLLMALAGGGIYGRVRANSKIGN